MKEEKSLASIAAVAWFDSAHLRGDERWERVAEVVRAAVLEREGSPSRMSILDVQQHYEERLKASTDDHALLATSEGYIEPVISYAYKGRCSQCNHTTPPTSNPALAGTLLKNHHAQSHVRVVIQ